MIQYFIQTSNGQEGPFTLEELKFKKIQVSTPVWFDEISGWTNAGQIDALKTIIQPVTPPPFSSTNPPPYDTSSQFDDQPRRQFKLSLFQWGGIGILVVAAFMYFSKQGDASPSSNYQSLGIDSVDSMASFESDEEIERKRINAAITAKNRNYRNNWDRYIEAVAGSHKINPLGGVYDLEVVVQNQTDYPIDEVHVAVRYIKDNGGTHKVEYVTIYNVPANGKASMPAPDSSRGTSVEFEIGGIISKKMHFFYSPDVVIEGKDDPYFRKY